MKGEILSIETTKYIQELKNIIESQSDIILELQEKIDKVKEYIEKHTAIFKGGDMLVDMNINELVEILDKEGKDE